MAAGVDAPRPIRQRRLMYHGANVGRAMAHRKTRRRTGRGRGPLLLLLIGAIAIGALLYRSTNAPLRKPTMREQAISVQTPVPVQATALLPQTPEPASTPASAESPASTPSTSSAPDSGSAAHRLAIIIDDCGQWPIMERALIALPIPITMSVMPKERYTQVIAQEAHAAGKGVMMHLPMEPVAAMDPGPGKITTTMTDADIVAQVKDDIARVPLARGVNNHEGSKASADPRVMKDVVSVLAPEGLFFIDSRTIASSVAAQVAADAGMRTASRDIFLDNKDDVESVKTMLRQAATVAMQTGSAIAIGHPRKATLEAIRALIPDLQAQGITFTQAADLVH